MVGTFAVFILFLTLFEFPDLDNLKALSLTVLFDSFFRVRELTAILESPKIDLKKVRDFCFQGEFIIPEKISF